MSGTVRARMTQDIPRFHDLYETDPRITELRELHAAGDILGSST